MRIAGIASCEFECVCAEVIAATKENRDAAFSAWAVKLARGIASPFQCREWFCLRAVTAIIAGAGNPEFGRHNGIGQGEHSSEDQTNTHVRTITSSLQEGIWKIVERPCGIKCRAPLMPGQCQDALSQRGKL